ncbi:MAG: pyridoxal phosphate-dependent aminotransferase [Candidatus Hodarchaeota archaeon]
MRFTAKRMDVIPPSGTLDMFEKASELERSGKKIIHLDLGEPDFITPESIRKEAILALEKGFTHYTTSIGIRELREAIAEDLKTRDVDIQPEKEIIVTSGGKHAIMCAMLATINPGDEVLILTPAWPTYSVIIRMAGGIPVEVPTSGTYSLNEETLKKSLSDKTKLIVVNSPNNPTGGILTKEEMKAIADLATDKDLLVLSDEIYDRFVYDGEKQVSMGSFSDLMSRTILINGFSKTYAMTGWRLGYAAARKEIIANMLRIQQNSTTCPTSFAQKAALASFREGEYSVGRMIEEYDRRRKIAVSMINDIEGISCSLPKGAFYVFPDISSLGLDSKTLAMQFLEEAGVSTIPGSVFAWEGHIRISYATSAENIIEGFNRIKGMLEKLKS